MNKIYVRMNGRLGNQLFRYAVARSIQERMGGELVFDWQVVLRSAKENPDEDGFEDSLRFFRTKPYTNGSATVLDLDKGTVGQKTMFAVTEVVRIFGEGGSETA